jgi:hypothetical protein
VNVLVIPEDFRHDQYILKPIIKAMMTAVGRPRAIVKVCNDPLLGSVNEALKWERARRYSRIRPPALSERCRKPTKTNFRVDNIGVKHDAPKTHTELKGD